VTNHISRAGWNARPPDSTTPLDRSRIQYFIVHYSGEIRSQSVRSIQDYCMDVKGHVDIDYNRIVRDDNDYMGRGWNVGGHTKDMNSVSYGVCVIGLDGDATDADMRTVREIYDEICASLGRPLIMTDHQTLLGASYTDCPGSELHNWVATGMPYPEEDMTPEQSEAFNDLIWRVDALFANTDLRGGRYESDPTLNQNMAKAALDAVAADVDELQARPPAPPAEVDVPALVAALTPAIRQIVREEIDDTKLGQMP